MKRKEDLRTLFILFLAWFTFYLNWTFVIEIKNRYLFWFLEPIFFAINCSLFFCCAVANHNIVHTPVFFSKKLNSLVNVILTLSYGHPSTTFVPGHNLSHHKFTQSTKDFMRTSKVKYRWNLLNGILFFFLITKDALRNDFRYFKAQRNLNRPVWKQARLEIISLVVFTLVTLFLNPYKFLVICYIPQYFAKWGITTINLLQHDGCDISLKDEHSKKYNGARNFTGRLLNWFTMNNGFHQIHHMFPAVHWSALPEKHKDIIEPHNHPNLNVPNMATYIFEAYVWPGIRMNYDGTPYVEKETEEDVDWFYEEEETDSESVVNNSESEKEKIK
jgi:fatty acid desaturase